MKNVTVNGSAVLFGLVLAAGACSPSRASELTLLGGGSKGYHNLTLAYQASPFWRGQAGASPLELSLEYSVGGVEAPNGQQSNRTLWHVGVAPMLRWWFAPNTGAEFGIGANVFSGTDFGSKRISTAYQFGDSVGVFHRLQGTSWLLGLRYTHYSNADIKRPNPGQDYVQLRISYVFR
ncbi:MAG: acyloxyacyl hydrolase [Betaproteobacteria bacterium]|nr:acyloxyacyl hydrolase [Betaproteobacteria bacterium]MDE2124404.1 acyloxyacyl hydrolase [Betaproteobacteria bacterium]MDE2186792.1 acyloxyacyl hydrolase [Betaproteobacteria bacterium]MDE2325397.1 acyloxyacyl hydrolase [Betaproteobacteria bacterium]